MAEAMILLLIAAATFGLWLVLDRWGGPPDDYDDRERR